MGRPFHLARPLARRALGRRDRRIDLADGPSAGRPRRHGRHGRAPRSTSCAGASASSPRWSALGAVSPIRRARCPAAPGGGRRGLLRGAGASWPRARQVSLEVSRAARGGNEHTASTSTARNGALSYRLDRAPATLVRGGELRAAAGDGALLAPVKVPAGPPALRRRGRRPRGGRQDHDRAAREAHARGDPQGRARLPVASRTGPAPRPSSTPSWNPKPAAAGSRSPWERRRNREAKESVDREEAGRLRSARRRLTLAPHSRHPEEGP